MTDTVTSGLTVGQVERKYGISGRALRFYEEKGLLSPPRINNRRAYQRTCLDRLEVILKCKRCGVPIDEIARILAVLDGRHGDDAGLTKIEMLLEDHLSSLQSQRQQIDKHIINSNHLIATLRDSIPDLKPAKQKESVGM